LEKLPSGIILSIMLPVVLKQERSSSFLHEIKKIGTKKKKNSRTNILIYS
jgi:hypothetical protein